MYVRYLGQKKMRKKEERLFSLGQEMKPILQSLHPWLLADFHAFINTSIHSCPFFFFFSFFLIFLRKRVHSSPFSCDCFLNRAFFSESKDEWLRSLVLHCCGFFFFFLEVRNMPEKVQEWRKVIFTQPCLIEVRLRSCLVLCLWQCE